jgi:HlyD family secretion protein
MKSLYKILLGAALMLIAGILVGCANGTAAAANGTPQATVLPAVHAGNVVADGKLVPAQSVNLSFHTTGIVEKVLIDEGQPVKKDQVIAQLSGNEKTLSEKTAAEQDLLAAQEDLNTLNQNAALDLAKTGMDLADAQKELDKATTARASRQYRYGSDEQVDVANADVILARERVRLAQEAYDAVQNLDETDPVRAGALSALASAKTNYDRVVANFDYLKSMPNQIEVNLAEARLQLAQQNVASIKAKVERLSHGADSAQVKQIQARINSAQARIDAANSALKDLVLTSPIDGIVVRLPAKTGELVSPGNPNVVIANLNVYQVELVNLTEIQVGRIKPNQTAVIKVDAFPDLKLTGKVLKIDQFGDNHQGDIVYRTIIALDKQDPQLRWNMTVSVEIQP